MEVGKIDIGMTRINFWDLGGQTDLQTLWQSYYAESHAILFMVPMHYNLLFT
jgi:ADP-ribosylation factor related protein 1